MLIAAIILFISAMSFGLVLLTALLQERVVNNKALLAHGIIAGIAILLMIIYLWRVDSSASLITSLVLFIGAAIGGLTLAHLDFRQGIIPKVLVVLHPLVALAGLVVLISYVLP